MSLKHIERKVEEMRKKGTLPDLGLERHETPFGDIIIRKLPRFTINDNSSNKIDSLLNFKK
jgi:hypothetical protein